MVSNSFTQDEDTYPIKNNISITYTPYYFFDGSPVFQFQYFPEFGWQSSSLGIEYKRLINATHGWSIGIEYFDFVNHTPTSQLEAGVNWERQFTIGRINYHYSIWNQGRQYCTLVGGIAFRGGTETKFGSYFFDPGPPAFGETFVISKTYLDVGLTFGIRYHVGISKRINFSSELNYNLYPYTFDKKGSHPLDNGPNFHHLSLRLGFGINFGSLDKTTSN